MSTLDDTEVTRTSEGTEPQTESTITRGDVVDRFSVLAEIGVGGMGRIFEAYDPKLDRRIALKVLRDAGADAHRQRLVREAQALARLDHPNVVTVHDVGTHGDALFVAMEFVPSGTLKTWLADNPPSSSRQRIQTALELLVDAGRGLVAAHAAGLVHRDIKPSNILIGHDGRARVADFGIARALDADPPTADPIAETGDDLLLQTGDSNSADLTRTGASVGTPAYMAPEQFGAKSVGPAADQFSYCVTAWELLYGVRPFSGDTVRALLRSIGKGTPTKPDGVEVSPELESLLRRGLKARASARHRHLVELVHRIEAIARTGRPRRSATKWWLAGLGGVAAVAGVSAYQAGQTTSLCEGAEEAFANTWNEERRGQVRAAVLGTEQPFAPKTWARVERHMDAYADEWIAAHRETCEATRVRGEQSTERMDQRMVCLQGARRAAGAFLDLIAEGDPYVIAQADAKTLPFVQACETPAQSVPTSKDTPVLQQVADSIALRTAGRWAEALSTSRAAVQLVGDDAAEVTRAKAHLEFAKCLQANSDRASAQHFMKAADSARRAKADDLLADAGYNLAEYHLVRERTDAAQWWFADASAATDRGSDDQLRWGQAFISAKLVARKEGFEAGTRAFEALVSLSDRTNFWRANSRLQLAQHLGTQNQATREVVPILERSLELAQAEFGERHPQFARYLLVLCRTRYATGDTEGAMSACQSGLEITRGALGPRNIANAALLQMLARMSKPIAERYLSEALALDEPFPIGSEARAGLLRTSAELAGRSPRAVREAREAVQLFESSLGPLHTETLTTRGLLASVLVQMGEVEAAQKEAQATAELLKTLSWERSSNMLTAFSRVHNVFGSIGDFEPATAMATDMLEGFGGPDNLPAEVASVVNGALCEDFTGLGRPEDALPYCEASLDAGSATPANRAASRINLAAILFELGRLEKSKSVLLAAFDDIRTAKDPTQEAVALANLGELEEKLGELGDSAKHSREAMELMIELYPSPLPPTFPGLGLVRVLAKQSRFDEASAQLKALEPYVPAANPHGQGQLAETRGLVLELRKKPRAAKKQFARAVDLYRLAGAEAEVSRLCHDVTAAPDDCRKP